MTTIPALIGLHGFTGSGKDTAADILGVIQGYERYAFADALRDALETIDPLVGAEKSLMTVVDELSWEEAKRHRIYGPELRRLMQRTNDAFRALFGDDVWLNILIAEIASSGGFSADHPVVISDVRHDNEAEWIRSQGGLVWRIVRPGTGPLNDHLSEAGLSPHLVDRTIRNDSTRAVLSARVAEALQESIDTNTAQAPMAA